MRGGFVPDFKGGRARVRGWAWVWIWDSRRTREEGTPWSAKSASRTRSLSCRKRRCFSTTTKRCTRPLIRFKEILVVSGQVLEGKICKDRFHLCALAKMPLMVTRSQCRTSHRCQKCHKFWLRECQVHERPCSTISGMMHYTLLQEFPRDIRCLHSERPC